MVRALSGNDPDRYPRVLGWPLGEALALYQNLLRAEQREDYRLTLLLWSNTQRRKKPPPPPPLLREE